MIFGENGRMFEENGRMFAKEFFGESKIIIETVNSAKRVLQLVQ